MPDLLAATYQPQVTKIGSVSTKHISIIAYLRSVYQARLETIAQRVNFPITETSRCVEALLDVHIISRIENSYRLDDEWKEVLPEVVAIEVKVSDWKRGLQQAARNLLFSNKSFLALPLRTAARIKGDEFAESVGIGLIGIDDTGALRIVRRGRRGNPKVWSYYYGLAKTVGAGTRRS